MDLLWQNYLDAMYEVSANFTFDEKIIDLLKKAPSNDQVIFIAGNGGSAAIANHAVSDFSFSSRKYLGDDFTRFKVLSLSRNIEYISAIANDMHYKDIYSEQLKQLAKENDILILISSSGNSPNIINALEVAKKKGLIVIGVSGFDGGRLLQMADLSAHVSVNSYEMTENMHVQFMHFLSLCIKEN